VVLILDPDIEQHIVQLGEDAGKHVDIESALTANVIRGAAPSTPPISAIASASSNAVCVASRSNGIPAAVAVQGFSRTTSTWPTRCSRVFIR
jgi:hypothetical protein